MGPQRVGCDWAAFTFTFLQYNARKESPLLSAAVLDCVPTFQPTSVKIIRRNTNSSRAEQKPPPRLSVRVWGMGGIITFCPTNNHSTPQQQGGEQNAYPLQKAVGRVWAIVMHQLLKSLSMTRIFHFSYTFIFQAAFYLCDFLWVKWGQAQSPLGKRETE